ncbi:DUF1810 domain-containing protein [Ponticoccus alexandrii]|uniref:DUF1810 family protein n=1 Tax=Ponticoccus alexandrii TaxID=1943633 RepID=A0ABX7FCQ3_9RHOB|nr:DUF1810 domain-containing protein [Ponticoccus alexandrii]ETA52984.1 calpastatin [Rhodobacteraceae bacterium PD-2]QRF68269.1 DUF1810 family protein [Ponticoccus alexandrii]
MAEFQEFVDAQDAVWTDVLRELRAGQKTSHWIWWVFPQLRALGRSPRALHFGLAGLDEATAYLSHPILGPRLLDCTALLLTHDGTDPERILGPVDALKVRSCMTLFKAVPKAPAAFSTVLDRLYGGDRCPVTTRALSA